MFLIKSFYEFASKKFSACFHWSESSNKIVKINIYAEKITLGQKFRKISFEKSKNIRPLYDFRIFSNLLNYQKIHQCS